MNEISEAAAIVQKALDAAGGVEKLTALLQGIPTASDALARAGGAQMVAEALITIADETTIPADEPTIPADALEAAKAIQAAGGPFVIAEALHAGSGNPDVSAAIAAAGGLNEIAKALAVPGHVILAQALQSGGTPPQ